MASTAIIVIGASAGGVEAVSRVVKDLPPELPAAVCVAMHFPGSVTSVLPRILERAGKLPARHPLDRELIEPGTIYVAPPDHHLMVGRSRLRIVRGPRESGHRPAIDPMFRSAAVSHGSRVIGVILTGNLDDGTAGLMAIERRGGRVVVQDPVDALFSSMPRSAVDHVAVDLILPVAEIGRAISGLVEEIARTPVLSQRETTSDDARETAYDELDLTTIEEVELHPGQPSQFGCPDCGGVLWEIKDGELTRYRCRVGHAWSGEALMTRQSDQLDTALWVALRTLEEHASLNRALAQRVRKRGNGFLAGKYERDAREAYARAATIREFLVARTGTAQAAVEESTQQTGTA